jgi:hypothetical protein
MPLFAIAMLGSLGAFVAVATLGIALAVVRYDLGTKSLAWVDRRRRELGRRELVREAGMLREHEYKNLKLLVAQCNANDQKRFELEGLLDRFATLALAHRRQLDALDFTPLTNTAPPHTRQHEIRARRMRHRDACLRTTVQLEEELSLIDETTRLIVERCTTPMPEVGSDELVDHVVGFLDEVEVAYAELDGLDGPRKLTDR